MNPDPEGSFYQIYTMQAFLKRITPEIMKSRTHRPALLFLVMLSPLCNYGQDSLRQSKDKDTLRINDLDEVMISATRTERLIKDIPMPVSVIKGEAIERMGALRLNEVLSEQTGIQVIQDHGSGVQIQGLSTDYVLILIDGEPVVGRTKGNLDLTRLVVGNIERIEVVKGPSSSLFGSEAMGGVINIITKKAKSELNGSFRSRYRRYNTLDLSAEAGQQHEKLGWYLFANRMSSDGYFSEGATSRITKTMAPFTGYTLNGKLSYKFTKKTELVLNTRFYNEDQYNNKLVNVNSADRMLNERTNRKDISFTPTFYWTIAPGRKLQLRNYITGFQTSTRYNYADTREVYDDSYFRQYFNRTELQYDHQFNDRHLSTVGLGNVIEEVDATRYDSRNAFNQMYLFGQHQWQPLKTVNVVGGFRYDRHNQYADRFSPKLALGWNIHKVFSLQASVAGGYKAPTFEQLLLNFTNPTVGYSVFGTNTAAAAIRKLEEEGQIQQILIDPATIGPIRAERSMAYNFGFKLTPVERFTLQVNVFRNNISDMIDFNTIAIKTNQGAIYSYFNRNRVFTQGVEVNGALKLPFGIELCLGYQYLDAKDADVWEKVKNGKLYYRDAETNLDYKVRPEAYGGLYNRSRHTGNIRINYDNKKYKFDVSLRGIYRSRFGNGQDVNGNAVLDDDREYVSGYQLWNLSVRKFFKHITAEAGVNNIFSVYTPYDPTTPALNWYVGLALQLQKPRN
jgi:outer membrane receptor for ferrienterochelin and colicins